MNVQFDPRDIELIAEEVAAKLLPLLRKESSRENSQEWLTVEELAKMLNVHKSWVYRRTQLGGIPYTKPGKYVMFRKDKVEEWLDNNTLRQSGRDN